MTYQILFCTNLERDLKYLCALTGSLVEHFRHPEQLHFHLCWFGEEERGLDYFQQYAAHLPSRLTLHRIHDLVEEHLGKPGFGYWAYLWALQFLPIEAERLLHLDPDMLVCDDLSDLWEVDFEDCLLAAVYDAGGRRFGFDQTLAATAADYGLSFEPGRRYFNMGFQLLNLPAWRRFGVVDKVLKNFGDDFDRFFTHDQDGLNLLFAGRIKPLSPRFNMLENVHLYESWDFELFEEFEPPEDYFEASVRHFAGEAKIDSLFARYPERELYYRYLRRTPWWQQERVGALSPWRKTLSRVLQLHYLLVRGLRQGALKRPWSRLFKLLHEAPYLPVLYPAIPIYRLYRKLMKGFS